MNAVKKLIEKYRNIGLYLFFGICTTLINVMIYWLAAYPFNLGVMPSTLTAWFVAVLFAYLTNRKWVFHSTAQTGKELIYEMLRFFLARLSTGIVDWICMFILVDLLGCNDMIIKFCVNILVIVLNYIVSKLIIFHKND